VSTSGLAARTAAWRVLHDIRKGIPFDLALERALGPLPEADRGLAHELAAGVLRHRSTVDAAIAPHLDRGLDRIRDDLLDILRLGAYQLLYLDRVPRHAAVDTAVSLGRRIAGARVGGFINAVLRKISEAGPLPAAAGAADDSSAAMLALRYSHPEWLVARWVDRYGFEEAERLLQVNNTRPPLVVQPAHWDAETLIASFEQQRIVWRPAPFGAGLTVEGRRPQELPGFAAGSCFVQDPAQALVVRYFGRPNGALLYDACAAPGGKAIGLSREGFVVAGDLRHPRTRRLRENLRRAGQASAVLTADAAAPPVRPFPAVLLDAPCLGTGTFSRHPDARWRVSLEALLRLAGDAARLLRALADVVRPGGLLFFATCSLEPEENHLQIASFLAGDPRFRRDDPGPAPAELLTPEGDLMLLPHRHGTDGAYAVRLRRIG
jgi:16S rRNA (cytosine967-C5)-methyltransferase